MSALLLAWIALALPQDDGIIRVRSTRGMDVTVAALDSVARARGLTVFARIDHAANAKDVGLELRPTTLFVLVSSFARRGPLVFAR
jgi:uncharacterized protein (DUF302 family)